MRSTATLVAPASSGAGRYNPAPAQARLAALHARMEELAARPLLAEPFMQPLFAACAALAATHPSTSK